MSSSRYRWWRRGPILIGFVVVFAAVRAMFAPAEPDSPNEFVGDPGAKAIWPPVVSSMEFDPRAGFERTAVPGMSFAESEPSVESERPILGEPVFGRVVDDRGIPFPNVRVDLIDGDETIRLTTIADGMGAFRFEHAPDVRDIAIQVTSIPTREPFATQAYLERVIGQPTDAGVIIRPRPATVRGIVLDENGTPVAGVVVHCDSADENGSSQTGADGKFELHVEDYHWNRSFFAEGVPSLEVYREEEKVSLRIGETVENVIVRLVRGREAKGRVIDEAGSPVANAVITLSGERSFGVAESAWDEDLWCESETDGEGWFTVRVPREPVEFGIELEHPEVEFDEESITFSEEPRTLVVQRRAKVHLVAVDSESGERILGVPISVGFIEGLDTALHWITASDSDWIEPNELGTYSWTSKQGPVLGGRLVVEAQGYFRTRIGPFERETFDGRVLEVPLTRGGTVEGTILDADGTPRAGVSVYARIPSSAGPDESVPFEFTATSSDASGAYSLHSLPEGEVEIAASLHDSPSERVPRAAIRCVLEPNPNPTRVDLRLPRLGSIEGRVTESGRPARDRYRVQCMPADGVSFGGDTDEHGRFQLADVPPGPVELVASHGREDGLFEDTVRSQSVHVVAGGRAVVDFDFPATVFGTLRGRVTRFGVPLAGGSVEIVPANRAVSEGTCSIDDRGKFGPIGCSVGAYALRIRDAGEYEIAVRMIEIGAGQELDLDVVLDSGRIRGRVIGAEPRDSDSSDPMIVYLRPQSSDWILQRHVHNLDAVPVGADGAFAFPEVAAGEYVLELVVNDHPLEREFHVVKVRPGEESLTEIRVEPKGSLEVESENLPDELRDAKWIVLRAIRGDGTKQRLVANRMDDSASFRATGLPPGKYTMTAGSEWKREDPSRDDSFVELGSFEVEIQSGQPTKVRLRVDPSR